MLIEQRNEGKMNSDFRKSQIQALELMAFFFLLFWVWDVKLCYLTWMNMKCYT